MFGFSIENNLNLNFNQILNNTLLLLLFYSHILKTAFKGKSIQITNKFWSFLVRVKFSHILLTELCFQRFVSAREFSFGSYLRKFLKITCYFFFQFRIWQDSRDIGSNENPSRRFRRVTFINCITTFIFSCLVELFINQFSESLFVSISPIWNHPHLHYFETFYF